ncbi:MAG: glutamine-hydrolyzing carbamoyl-phosphate synthase small subunit [Planctomycetes bacterium]|nr:glutamine-hydrolyzing carbamoyl-phosphate synthase small subunit [Planctomycetota bacterium]
MTIHRCYLGLEDGTVFAGQGFGARGTAVGEVVFNTAMCGYQEILTDPSYCGQIVTMTAPLIGNYGINTEDLESNGQHLSGFVVKELSRRVSNQRASGDLDAYLKQANVIGISSVDTRAITKRLRERGALRGVISTELSDPAQLVARAKAAPEMTGQNLVDKVKPAAERVYHPSSTPQTMHVVAIDCGIKENIIRHLTDRGCSVRVVPSGTSAESILGSKPDGVLAGNGPGDPAAVTDTIDAMRAMIGRVPIFGICLGHQLLSLALGAKTYKLKFGHHGANHPVLNVDTGRVEITSQNHGFAVDVPSLEAVGGRVTHVNLYDQSLEGFAHRDRRVFAVQYHPEAAPGPHDSGYLFQQFVELMRGD